MRHTASPRRPVIALAVLVVAVVAVAVAARPGDAGLQPRDAEQTVRINEDARLMQEFGRRVEAYVALRDQIETVLPPLGPNPGVEQAHAHRMELARRLRIKRGGAHEGDLFTREIRALFRRLIARALTADEVARLREELRSDEAPHFMARVHGGYLESVGLVSVPPALLLNFPALLPELEYRLVGEDLVLRDARAGLIVDFVHDALPRRGR